MNRFAQDLALNNRELSLALWSAAAPILLLVSQPGRRTLAHAIRAIVRPAPAAALVGAAVWMSGGIALLGHLGLWTPSHLASTGIAMIAFLILAAAGFGATSRTDGFDRCARDVALAVGVIVMVSNLGATELWIELLLVPLIAVLVLQRAMPDNPIVPLRVRGPLDRLIGLGGMGLFACGVFAVAREAPAFHQFGTPLGVTLSVLLGLLFYPFLVAQRVVCRAWTQGRRPGR